MWRTRAQAAILEAEGDAAGAAVLIDGLTQAYGRHGLEDERLWGLLDAGAIRAPFDRQGAIDAYTRAASLANEIGAEGRERIAARALRRLGVRAWRRGRDNTAGVGLASLSARELEVARHAAGGASNREIAEALVLSPKTVERHVTNILAKVGARNRTELAALVHSHPAGESTASARRTGQPGSAGTGFSR